MVFELAKGNAFVYTSNDLIAKKDWKGTKEIPADGAFVYTSATKYDMRVNPVNVDAKELSYTLTNTKNGDIPNITLKATEQNEMFTTSSVMVEPLKVMACMNCLWTTSYWQKHKQKHLM